jgi:hypothetical protein
MVADTNGVINRTTDGGASGIPADSGIDKTAAAFVAPVRECPSNDDVFLTGTNRVWRTDNFFSSASPSWVANGPLLTGQNGGGSSFPNSPASILEIEFALYDSTCNTYVLGDRRAEVRLTRDGGNTWVDLDLGKSLPPRPVNGLAFDPNNPNILYAALSSFDDGTPGKPGHVFKTTNALSASPTWMNVSPPLNQPFNVIRVDPTNSRLIYAGSDTGPWHSTDGAATWVHDGPQVGLPNAPVYDIKINPTTGRTVFFTYGRGAFALGPGLTGAVNGATYFPGGLVASSPGIFPVIVNGTNYPAGVFLDGSITGDPANGSAFRKARPGDVIQLYATGLAPSPARMIVGYQPLTGVTVMIGSVTFPADTAGLVAAGEFQINFTVPQQFASLPEGNYPVTIQVNEVLSPMTINSNPPVPLVLPIQH